MSWKWDAILAPPKTQMILLSVKVSSKKVNYMVTPGLAFALSFDRLDILEREFREETNFANF
jgi:hypothetical protein